VKRAIADTSVFVAQETGRELGELPEKIAVSVITAAELELGVLRAQDTDARARRIATLSRVRSAYTSWTRAGSCVGTMPGSLRQPFGIEPLW